MQIGKYPEAMYRVSLKVIIRNQSGEVLVVREKGSGWSLPGGGVDHGEEIGKALKRELYEEVLIDAPFTSRFVGADTFYVEHRQRWQMWLVYELDLAKGYAYGKGIDADEVAFMDPAALKDSKVRSEQLVYKWCMEKE
jgi:ADP-ribose pyrophosphatase YjhB (NUDIX family)